MHILRFNRVTDDGVRGYKSLVGERHPGTRDQLGTRYAEALPSYPQGWKAAALLHNLWWDQCLQRSNNGTEEAPFTLRSPSGTKQHSQPRCRFHRKHSRGQNPQRYTLPSSPSARHVWHLPETD